jgi:hypothetical protein
MSTFLTIEYLRERTGIKLVSSLIPTFRDGGQTYATLEQETESKTHREMRAYAIMQFHQLGYRIYPSGIGVEGIFTLADFLAFRDGRVVFVECLTDAKATPQDIERKLQLKQFGEVCFVVVSGHGCLWENDNRKIPKVFQTLAQEADVLTYFYGHWQNGFQKGIARLTRFPRVFFDVGKSDPIRLSIAIRLLSKTAKLNFAFKTMPYRSEDGLEFLRDEAGRLAWQVYCWRKFDTASKFDMGSQSGKIFKDDNGRLVAQVCVRNGAGCLKVRGRQGLKVLELFLSELQKGDLAIEVDQRTLERTRQKLEKVTETQLADRALMPHPIESNLYETGQIVWVLNHFFANGPVKVSEFVRYLPERIVSKLSYWLRRGVSLRDLQEVGTSRRLMERFYVASKSSVERVRRDLSEVHWGEIPGKGRPYKIVHFVRHGKYLECPPREQKRE